VARYKEAKTVSGSEVIEEKLNTKGPQIITRHGSEKEPSFFSLKGLPGPDCSQNPDLKGVFWAGGPRRSTGLNTTAVAIRGAKSVTL